jgi:hypothetical protein
MATSGRLIHRSHDVRTFIRLIAMMKPLIAAPVAALRQYTFRIVVAPSGACYDLPEIATPPFAPALREPGHFSA